MKVLVVGDKSYVTDNLGLVVAQFRGKENKEAYKFSAASEMLKALKLAEEYVKIAEQRGYPAENTLSVIRAAISKAEGRGA